MIELFLLSYLIRGGSSISDTMLGSCRGDPCTTRALPMRTDALMSTPFISRQNSIMGRFVRYRCYETRFRRVEKDEQGQGSKDVLELEDC